MGGVITMAALTWDATEQRKYDLGISKVVLYKYYDTLYDANYYDPSYKVDLWLGAAWNGVVNITESPEGGEPNDIYADNLLYASIRGTEKFAGSIDCFSFPDEFRSCIGGYSPIPGLSIGQQKKERFALCYRTEIGQSNDPLVGYKIHIVYNCIANSSEDNYDTINDSPDVDPMSFDFSCVPEPIIFSSIYQTTHQTMPSLSPVSHLVIDSTKINPTSLRIIENVLYGTGDSDDGVRNARLIFPGELHRYLARTIYVNGEHYTLEPYTFPIYAVGSIPDTVETLT
mgnify:CR=1 FL=1